MNKILIIGMGYIGLPTAAILASNNKLVVGYDINADIVDKINLGRIHIIEPGLEELIANLVSKGNIRATLVPETADVFMIAVPTPFKGDKVADMQYVEAACHAIAPYLESDSLILLESTSPVGTTEKISKLFSELRPDLIFPVGNSVSTIAIAYCPERVLPGVALKELVENDRIIGGITLACSIRAKNFYEIFTRGKCHITDSRTAELCKLVENSSRDVGVAFANELSLICDKLQVNVWELIKLANYHPRVNIMQPGAGVGGHCIAVDPWFIVESAPELSGLIKKARDVNDTKPAWVIKKILDDVDGCISLMKGSNQERKIVNVLCLGLAFKPNIDDLRGSPALEIVKTISEMADKFSITVIEPNIDSLPEVLSGLKFSQRYEDFLDSSDIVVALVNHKEFSLLKRGDLVGRKLIDVCGALTH